MLTVRHLLLLPAFNLDILALQICSLLVRKPSQLSKRDQQTLTAASAYVQSVLQGIRAVDGKEIPDLKEENVQAFGFAARAEAELLQTLPAYTSLEELFAYADSILSPAAAAGSLTNVDYQDITRVYKLFNRLADPAREDLKS